MRTKLLAGALALSTLVVGVAAGGDHGHGRGGLTQEAPVVWHAQSGNVGTVGPDAAATLRRTPHGIRYRFSTARLTTGHAYTLWMVVVNDPAQCADSPCAPPTDIIANPATDSQVTFADAGKVAHRNGTAVFRAGFRAGPLLDGWLPVQGLDDPMGAEIHFVLNDHGPIIEDLRAEMTGTYRAGCTDTSLPPFFPPAAFADGSPGPNTCRLHQVAVFLPPTPSGP